MGVQKNKRSKARTRKKRSIWAKLDSPNRMECPQCHKPKLPHRVCPECGYYKNREVVKQAVAE
ncbi:MAG: 50S ribosomal protein L32 [Peptococcaceae bacterium BICA1-8]|nr:MAG: 50S ribosomal protein L32 [Clostridiaceae bacterium BRH_c20a]KJS81222.1 MAG: 50S ribosomal protein L32 [Peptococcaceae bacterium BICA1-8]